jgi:hypothetical protein
VEARAYLELASGTSAPAAAREYRERAASFYKEVTSSFRSVEGAQEAASALAKLGLGDQSREGRSR